MSTYVIVATWLSPKAWLLDLHLKRSKDLHILSTDQWIKGKKCGQIQVFNSKNMWLSTFFNRKWPLETVLGSSEGSDVNIPRPTACTHLKRLRSWISNIQIVDIHRYHIFALVRDIGTPVRGCKQSTWMQTSLNYTYVEMKDHLQATDTPNGYSVARWTKDTGLAVTLWLFCAHSES